MLILPLTFQFFVFLLTYASKVHAVQRKDTKELFAMKVMEKEKVLTNKMISNVMNERHILSLLDYPLVVNLRFAAQNEYDLFMVVDLMTGGDLRYHMKSDRPFSIARVRHYIAQTALAINYLHTQGYMHRDIKPDNCLLDAKGNLHLSDFNLSIVSKDNRRKGTAGTRAYMAPEVLLRQEYGNEVDWWSMGVMIFEISTRILPFMGNGPHLKEAILAATPKYPPTLDPQLQSLLKGLLKRDPKKRIGFEGIKSHPFMSECDWDALENKTATAPWLPDANKANCDGSYDLDEQFQVKKKRHPLPAEHDAIFKHWDWAPGQKSSITTLNPVPEDDSDSTDEEEEEEEEDSDLTGGNQHDDEESKNKIKRTPTATEDTTNTTDDNNTDGTASANKNRKSQKPIKVTAAGTNNSDDESSKKRRSKRPLRNEDDHGEGANGTSRNDRNTSKTAPVDRIRPSSDKPSKGNRPQSHNSLTKQPNKSSSGEPTSAASTGEVPAISATTGNSKNAKRRSKVATDSSRGKKRSASAELAADDAGQSDEETNTNGTATKKGVKVSGNTNKIHDKESDDSNVESSPQKQAKDKSNSKPSKDATVAATTETPPKKKRNSSEYVTTNGDLKESAANKTKKKKKVESDSE